MTENEFTDLITKLRPELVRIAARRCGRDHAEDAVQKAVTQTWQAGKWQDAAPAQVAGWLRHRTADRGVNELRGLGRLRTAQKNLLVLGDRGWKRANAAPYRIDDGAGERRN